MPKTRAQLIAEAQVVKNATEVGENTATRVGGVLEDLATDGTTFSTREFIGDVGIDATPTQGSNNLVKSGGVVNYINGAYPSPTPTIYSKWYVAQGLAYTDLNTILPSTHNTIALYDIEGIDELNVTIPKVAGVRGIAFDNSLPVNGRRVLSYIETTSGSAYSGTISGGGYKYLVISYDDTGGMPTAVGTTPVGGIVPQIDAVNEKVDALNNKLYNTESAVYIDEDEEAGDANYQYTKSGLVHRAAQEETFDTIELGLRYANISEPVNVLVKKGSSIAASVPAIYSISVIPSELSSTDLFRIELPEPVTLTTNEYLWVYSDSTSADNSIPFRVWTSNPNGTRVGMYFGGSLNTYRYSTAMRLLVRAGDVVKLKEEMANVTSVPTPEIITINDIYVVKGSRQRIYYNTFIRGRESDFGNVLEGLNFDAKCNTAAIGHADNEGFEIYTSQTGTFVVNVSVYDSLNRKLKTFAVNVHVGNVSMTSGKNVLMIGDSWTDPSFYNPNTYPTGKGYSVAVAEELQRHGVSANFVGSKFAGDTNVYNEGRGGWAWTSYVGTSSPFYNPNTQTIDFAYYRGQIGLNSTFDYVTFQLGVNDCLGAEKTEAEWQPTLNAITTLLNALLTDSPNCKVIINPVGLDAPTRSGWTSLYNLAVSKEVYQSNAYTLSRLVFELISGRNDYMTSVWMGQSYFGVNRWYGYGYIDAREYYFKVDESGMSSTDINTLKNWNFATNPVYVMTGGVEYYAIRYERGYVVCICYQRYHAWNVRDQQFVGDYTFPNNSVPTSGTLIATSSSSTLPHIPFSVCYKENNDLRAHYFQNATHPYDYGFRMLGQALAMQLLIL